MYRQVLIDSEERRFQRIFWPEKTNEPIHIFELNTITYGCSSSPFLACRSLHQLAYKTQRKYPRACHVILKDFYMYDLLSGANDIEQLVELQKQVTTILQDGGFELRKWITNKPEAICRFQFSSQLNSNILQLCPNESNKTLGIFWNANYDKIQYSIREFVDQVSITKRLILSIIGQIFNPLGLLGSVVINAKLILQLPWQEQLAWDQEVSPQLQERWLLATI